jgi:hypothetical protein
MAPWATVEKRRSSIQGGDDYYGIKMDFDPRRAEEYSGCIWELEPVRDAVKPTIRHEINRRDPKFIEVVSGGWPRILCSLKPANRWRTGAPAGRCSSLLSAGAAGPLVRTGPAGSEHTFL